MSEVYLLQLSSEYHGAVTYDDNDPGLPLHNFQGMSFMADSPPPLIPPPKHACSSQSNPLAEYEDGSDFLPSLFSSPTPARVANGSQVQLIPLSTPPSQHDGLPHWTSGLTTPDQHFNFADFLNVTPSPAQLV